MSFPPDANHDAACERILQRACVLELAAPDRRVLARLEERTPYRRGEVLADEVHLDVEALVSDAWAPGLVDA